MSVPSPILRAVDLVRVYRRGSSEVRALDGVSLEIGAGEYVAVMGRSGSGKTTLLDLLGCLLRPTGGELEIDGRSVIGLGDGELAAIRRERIGFIFQEFNLIPTLNALENVLLPLRYGRPRGADGERRARELLELVGLGHRLRHRPNELSGGEQQRVAIARLLVQDPGLVLADEPVSSLDPARSADVLALLTAIAREQGKTLVASMHEVELAKVYFDRLVGMRNGVVMFDQPAEDVDDAQLTALYLLEGMRGE